jgi:hypothetical protein
MTRGRNAVQIRIQNLALIWESPKWSFILALTIYALISSFRHPIWSVSDYPYYSYLADAFLHGQLHLRALPASTLDLVIYNGHYFLYWPPMPAILLMPFVALMGVGFSDIFFTLVVGALNVGLIALLLRRACNQGLLDLTETQRAQLVCFFALGTVHITLAPLGRIWFTGQVVAFFLTILAFLIPIRLSGWTAFTLTGLAVTCATLTRNHLLFIGIWPAYYLLQKHLKDGLKRLFGYALLGLLPLAIAGVAYLGYNYLRFGSILDVGLDYHKMAPIFAENYQRYGPFNLHYLPINFFYQYIFYPLPPRSNSTMGGSLFLLSPVFFGAFYGIARGQPRISVLFLITTILMINIPILLLMGTGWAQFGPRYSLDFTVPLLWLTAMGIRRWSNSLTSILVAISAIHYIGGYLLLLKLGL